MKRFKEFLIEQEITYAGFKTRKPDEQESNLLNARPEVAGFYGTGSMEDDGDKEGTIVINQNNQYMKNPLAQDGLKRNEAVRGIYKINPDLVRRAPNLTPEQDKNLDFYTKDYLGSDEEKRSVRKQTFYGRLAGGDESIDHNTITPEQREHQSELNNILSDKEYYGKIKAQRLKARQPGDTQWDTQEKTPPMSWDEMEKEIKGER
jgi:hypothetical protein